MSEITNEVWIEVSGNPPAAGEMRAVDVRGESVAIYNVDGELFATHNICTHAHALLTDGWLDDHVVECPLHAGMFDVRTGKGLGAPITCDLKVYPVRIYAGKVEIRCRDGD